MALSVGFIGSGMMASALMDGLLAKGIVTDPAQISCSDVWEPARAAAQKKGFQATASNEEVCAMAKDIIIIAVKPNVVPAALADIAKSASSNAVIISIAAGVTLSTLESHIPDRKVVRVMPNTPCLVGESAGAFALGQNCKDEDRDLVARVFGAVGIFPEVQEYLLDAVTGVSGSGPAYVFLFIEALSDGGVRAGLPRSVATQLAAQTVKGAAEMVLRTGKHPGELKDGVTSPGGTTIAGVEALEKGAFRATVISAVTATTKRSMQLGGKDEAEIRNKYNL
eukprot:scaffold170273_cov47-Attheya_sp.AAC.1